jgi:transposase
VARIPFVRHRTVNQIANQYRACRPPVEKTRWHALWLLARTDVPRTPAQVADLVGLSDVTVRDILHRWNADGPAGVADRRRNNGAAPKLAARQRQALLAALHKRPPDGGLWTGPKVARYVADRWRVAVDPTTGWRWLRDLGFTLQVPRPSHPQSADRPTRRRWGGKSPPPGPPVESSSPEESGGGVGRG